MSDSCKEKQARVIELFAPLSSLQEKYEKIIELGRAQKPLPLEARAETNLVRGCQSRLYLLAKFKDGLLFFQTESDALISSGLGVLLTQVYSEEAPEVVLKCPPTYLETIGIAAALSRGRSNGLYSLHLRMKQEALKAALDANVRY